MRGDGATYAVVYVRCVCLELRCAAVERRTDPFSGTRITTEQSNCIRWGLDAPTKRDTCPEWTSVATACVPNL